MLFTLTYVSVGQCTKTVDINYKNKDYRLNCRFEIKIRK